MVVKHSFFYYPVLILLLIISVSCHGLGSSALKTKDKPALIPYPEAVSWGNGFLNLKNGVEIFAAADFDSESIILSQQLDTKGINAVDRYHSAIPIHLEKNAILQGEAYQLAVSSKGITISAGTRHGMFNGIQTMIQLVDGGRVPFCNIKDKPAFAIRGYMIDVGRNYQSLPLIKQQIDAMAAYKLNVLHFHATEDIAWRFEIKKYPQLTASQHMQRDKGKYYTENEIKELQKYCADRHITFIPEIDMPGHSAAFKRAMGHDMQSKEGVAIVKDVLLEFIKTYQPSILHIGGDEVKITDQNFLPEMTNLVNSMGVKTMGWSPGGNVNSSTVRQLWKDGGGHLKAGSTQFVDSRHLYINHMDPLESVATIFLRQIGDRNRGDENMLGGILCNWPDRKVETELDNLTKSPAYPALLAFAERSWRGGGEKGFRANIGTKGEATVTEFKEFEDRLLYHKTHYFKDKPFPYVKQGEIEWKLYGPYANSGDLAKKFAPEEGITSLKPYSTMVGGTVILRHWWYPLVKGALDNVAKENTTWYASTRFWSEKDQTRPFWIGFNNISRSPATDSPPAGAWDDKSSQIWVNGQEIPPPAWKRASQKGDSEIPLIDEGYEYRAPTMVSLKKGWNEVLIKAPVGSFKGKDWQNPVKWMFTFAPAD